jgi:hypothetical protein
MNRCLYCTIGYNKSLPLEKMELMDSEILDTTLRSLTDPEF